jgi:hypothetical protein
VSLLIEDTLCYATFFCNTESLRLGLSDLMLHFVREAVAEGQCAKQIFAGLYKGGKGLDDFYLLRGCKLVRKPALLHINPLAAFFLKRFLPEQYARLRGDIKDAQGGRAFEDGTPSQRPRIRAISEETKAVELGGSSRCDDRAESSGATGSNKGHSGRRTLAGMLLRDLHAIAN